MKPEGFLPSADSDGQGDAGQAFGLGPETGGGGGVPCPARYPGGGGGADQTEAPARTWDYKEFHLTALAGYRLHGRVLFNDRYWFGREASLAPLDLMLGWRLMRAGIIGPEGMPIT